MKYKVVSCQQTFGAVQTGHVTKINKYVTVREIVCFLFSREEEMIAFKTKY